MISRLRRYSTQAAQHRAFLFLSLMFLGKALLAQTTRQRTTVDQPDDAAGYQVHALYMLPSDGADQQLDVNGKLETSAAAFQRWFMGQTGGPRLRLDTFQGRLDITFFRSKRSDAEIRSSGPFVRDRLEAEILGAGFNQPQKIYACIMAAAALSPVAAGRGRLRFQGARRRSI